MIAPRPLLFALAFPLAPLACSKGAPAVVPVDAALDAAAESPAASAASAESPSDTPSDAAAAPVTANLPGKDERLYRGTLDTKLAAVMRLTRNGSFLEGRYFYEAQGVDLALSGAIGKDGLVSLQETATTPTGKKQTGSFDGTFAPDGTFSGTWSDAAKTRAIAFSLKPVTPTLASGPVTVVKKKVQYTAKAAKPAAVGGTTCTIAVTYPEVLGAFDAKVEAAVNNKLRPENIDPPAKCENPMTIEGSFKVRLNRGGVLSVSVDGSRFAAGAAHPSRAVDFINVRVPQGDDVKLKTSVKSTGKPAFAAALEPQLAKAGHDADTTAALREALSVDKADFVLEEQGIRLFAINHLPHALQGASPEGFLVPYAAVRDALVDGTTIAAIAGKPKTGSGPTDAGADAHAPGDGGAAHAAAVLPPAHAAGALNPGVVQKLGALRKRDGGL